MGEISSEHKNIPAHIYGEKNDTADSETETNKGGPRQVTFKKKKAMYGKMEQRNIILIQKEHGSFSKEQQRWPYAMSMELQQ